ncbi:PDZ/DHR/GLGF domain protein [Dictyocaulus viviparus]|uniref:PDZ/DHR/GLGF domain protein n=1 Tax=Dictyocaulus viviparus TaxID=29172 RepID=A0A0D8XTT4_DICVI|nr:PDZ/DHR/GLGF domain protein [Dictyocaulus viviparus]
MEKSSPDQEYGYNLHAEKGRGQFVGMVDRGSPAELGGLRTGDRIFAVNGHSIIGESHKKVVERIKENAVRCEMLVISEEDAQWYNERGIEINMHLSNIKRISGMSGLNTTTNNSPPPAAAWYAPNAKIAGEKCKKRINSRLIGGRNENSVKAVRKKVNICIFTFFALFTCKYHMIQKYQTE